MYSSEKTHKKQVAGVEIQRRIPEHEKFRPCLGLSWLVDGFSLPTPKVSPRGISDGKFDVGKGLTQSTSVFPCQYNFINPPN